jgi:THO complex subunit 1
LQALENHKPTTHTASSSLLTTNYLSFSRLLPIQLHDAEFRSCLVTQFIIVAQHLCLEAPSVGNQLESYVQRARALLSTDERNQIDVVLAAEEHWRQWKKKKCPAMEATPRKRARVQSRREPSTTTADLSCTSAIDLQRDLPALSQRMRQRVPAVDQLLHDYVEALDPDSGIEAEYHPKNNTYVAWQALRLLPVQEFHRIHPNGDFEALVRHVWKEEKQVDIPGEAPVYEEEEEDVEEQVIVQETKTVASENGHGGVAQTDVVDTVADASVVDTDAEMMDVSETNVVDKTTSPTKPTGDSQTEKGSQFAKPAATATEDKIGSKLDRSSPPRLSLAARPIVAKSTATPTAIEDKNGSKLDRPSPPRTSSTARPMDHQRRVDARGPPQRVGRDGSLSDRSSARDTSDRGGGGLRWEEPHRRDGPRGDDRHRGRGGSSEGGARDAGGGARDASNSRDRSRGGRDRGRELHSRR